MQGDLIFNEIKKIAIKYSYNEMEITPETKLNDLFMDSDQTGDFFIEFENKFNMNFDHVQSELYFHDNSVPFSGLVLFIKSKILKKKTMKLSITIGHLIEVVKRGAWFDPLDKVYYEVRQYR